MHILINITAEYLYLHKNEDKWQLRDVETARRFTFFRIIANEDKKTGFPRFQSDDKSKIA